MYQAHKFAVAQAHCWVILAQALQHKCIDRLRKPRSSWYTIQEAACFRKTVTCIKQGRHCTY